MISEPVKMLRTLKVGHGSAQKIWLEGEIVHPPLPTEILQELKNGSTSCAILGKEPKPIFNRAVVKHFVPDVPDVDPVLDAVRQRTAELVKQEQSAPPPPPPELPEDTTSTTKGEAVHTSAPTFKRRKL